VTRLQTERPGSDSRQRQGFFFSSPQRPDRLWGPPCLSNATGCSFPGGG